MVERGARDQVLHIGNKDEPATLDPHLNNSSNTGILLSSLFEGLVRLASDGKTILPGAAESWEISPDGLTYTFHLRADGRWSNGDPVTATDFRDSYLRFLSPQLGAELVSLAVPLVGARAFTEGRSIDPASVGLRVVDSHTLIMVLAHPTPYWLSAGATLFPVHRASVEKSDGWLTRGGDWTRPGKLMSNGPFVLTEWRANAFVRVTRNERYWRAADVRLREIRFYPTDDENSEERTYRADQLHVTSRFPRAKLSAYEREGSAALHVSSQLKTDFLTFNVKVAPFTDARVRRALSLAIDRERLVRATLGSMGEPAATMVRPGTGGYTGVALPRFDPEEAKRLLAAAGFAGGTGLPKIELTLNGNAGRVLTIGEVIQQMWMEHLGVKAELRPLEFKVYSGLAQSKAFQALVENWVYDVDDPRDLLQILVTGDPNNSSGWSDPEYDAAHHAADATTDFVPRQDAFNRMEAMLEREAPRVPLFFTNQSYLVHPTVRGWRDNSLHVIDWRELWLEPKDQRAKAPVAKASGL